MKYKVDIEALNELRVKNKWYSRYGWNADYRDNNIYYLALEGVRAYLGELNSFAHETELPGGIKTSLPNLTMIEFLVENNVLIEK